MQPHALLLLTLSAPGLRLQIGLTLQVQSVQIAVDKEWKKNHTDFVNSTSCSFSVRGGDEALARLYSSYLPDKSEQGAIDAYRAWLKSATDTYGVHCLCMSVC